MTKIQLLEDDIDNGLPMIPGFCPVALAIKRARPDIERVSVGPKLIVVPGRCLVTPNAVSQFVNNFDAGLPVEPFEFDLDIPEDLTK